MSDISSYDIRQYSCNKKDLQGQFLVFEGQIILIKKEKSVLAIIVVFQNISALTVYFVMHNALIEGRFFV